MIIINLTLMMMQWVCFHILSSVAMILTLDLKLHMLCHKSWQRNFSKIHNSAINCSALQSSYQCGWRLVSVLLDQREIHFFKNIQQTSIQCGLVQCITVNCNYSNKTSPQAKRHKSSPFFTSLEISTSLTFITR